jgi:hypothetical protein
VVLLDLRLRDGSAPAQNIARLKAGPAGATGLNQRQAMTAS